MDDGQGRPVSGGGSRDVGRWFTVTLARSAVVPFLATLVHDVPEVCHMATTGSPTTARPTGSAPTRGDDTRQMAIAAAVYSGLTGLAYRRQSAGRRALGVFFAVMGLAWKGALTATAPEQFPMPARRAPWGRYRRAGRARPAGIRRGHDRGRDGGGRSHPGSRPGHRLGLLAVAAFSLGTTPLGTHTLGNPILAPGPRHLARRSWPTAAFGHRPPR